MKRRILWLILSCVMVAVLVLALFVMAVFTGCADSLLTSLSELDHTSMRIMAGYTA